MTLPARFLSHPLAHRGLHDRSQGRTENSLASVAAAIDAGYGIEIDVQISRDGVPMVFHDYHLARLTGEMGAIMLRDAAELTDIPLLSDTGTIPTLSQVLDAVAGQVPLLIEIKDQDGTLGPDTGPLSAAVADLVRPYDGEVALMSFNPHHIAEMARLLPDTPRGLVTDPYLANDWPTIPAATCAHLRDIPDFDRIGASFVSHNVRDLTAPRIAALKAQGAKILCWTVRSPAVEAEARKVADNITFEGYAA